MRSGVKRVERSAGQLIAPASSRSQLAAATGPDASLMMMGTELTDMPWPPVPIVTERLTLRPTCARDRPGYIDLLASDEVHEYLGGPQPRSELELHAPEIPGNRPGVFAVEALNTFIGAVGLGRRDWPSFRRAPTRPQCSARSATCTIAIRGNAATFRRVRGRGRVGPAA